MMMQGSFASFPISAALLALALCGFAASFALNLVQRKRMRREKSERDRLAASLDYVLYESRATAESVSIIFHVLLNNRGGSAFREALAFLAKTFGVPVACFLLDRKDGMAMIYDQDGYSAVLEMGVRRSLEDAFQDPVWRAGEKKLLLPLPESREMFSMVSPLKTRGVGLGYLVLARPSSVFSQGEHVRLSSIAESLSPVLASRFGRSVEERKRQKAERELAENARLVRAFLENSPDMVYRCDARDCIVSVNAAGLSMLGIKEASECLGWPYSKFVLSKSDRLAILNKIRSMGNVRNFEIVLVRNDGASLFCIESSQAYFGPDGSFEGVQGIVKDISERMESEQKIWKMAMDLSESHRVLEETRDLVIMQEKLASIGQIAAGVAHEINNPLGFLKSNREMQESYIGKLVDAWKTISGKHPVDAEGLEKRLDLRFAIENLEQMNAESKDGIERIVKIVSNLKTFARKDSGGLKVPYDINAGIESTLVMATNELKYVADVEKRLGEVPAILAEGSEINQVILNILVNAGQALGSQKRDRKGLITIVTRKADAGVECVIADDGPGMPPEVKSRIFEPFFTTKEPGKGTGLGLSISNDIVVGKHGGALSVESEPGKGTAFTIYLPAGDPGPAAGTGS